MDTYVSQNQQNRIFFGLTRYNLTFHFIFSEHRQILDPSKFTFEYQVTAIEDVLNKYLKRKPPDCGLF